MCCAVAGYLGWDVLADRGCCCCCYRPAQSLSFTHDGESVIYSSRDSNVRLVSESVPPSTRAFLRGQRYSLAVCLLRSGAHTTGSTMKIIQRAVMFPSHSSQLPHTERPPRAPRPRVHGCRVIRRKNGGHWVRRHRRQVMERQGWPVPRPAHWPCRGRHRCVCSLLVCRLSCQMTDRRDDRVCRTRASLLPRVGACWPPLVAT